MMVEKLVEVGNLFAFYGKLLTNRQYLVIELFYIHDLNLSEIGEELSITRQGVFDTLKRAEEKLYNYEEVLGLVSKFRESHNNVKKILKLSNNIKEYALESNTKAIIDNTILINNLGSKILENSTEVGE